MKKVEILKKNVSIANRNKSKENNYFYHVFMYSLLNTCTAQYYSIMCSIVSDFETPESFT